MSKEKKIDKITVEGKRKSKNPLDQLCLKGKNRQEQVKELANAIRYLLMKDQE